MSKIKTNGLVIEHLTALNNKYVLANGYLGLTGCLDELRQFDGAHLKVNCLIKDKHKGKYYMSVYNPMFTQINVNGTVLNPKFIQPKSHQQSLDLENGLFKRTTVYRVNGVDVKIYSERFLDQKNKSFIYSKYLIFVSENIDIEIIHGFDFENNNFEEDFEDVIVKNKEDITIQAKIIGIEKPLNIIYSFDKSFKHRNNYKDNKFQESYKFRADSGRDYQIIKYIGISTESRKNLEYLSKSIRKAKKIGYDKLLENNGITWSRLWKNSRLNIFNNDLVDRYNQFNQFQMISHRPISENYTSSRYGLTDELIDRSFTNEMYLFKYYLNTDYKSTRRMLMSRINQLAEAKEKAKELSKDGALYTDNQNNLYINALIVINLADYIDRTLDKSPLELGGLEMILEISKFYMDYITLNEKQTNHQVLNVSTVDNRIKQIDNSALLNYLIKDCLGKTANLVALAKTNNRKEVEEFLSIRKYDILISNMREARKKIYLQMPNVNNLIQIYDKYYKQEKILEFPDLLNLFLLYPQDFKETVKKENYLYYSNLVEPDSLGQFILSLIAVGQEFDKEANKYFKSYLPLNLYDNASKLNDEQAYLDLGLSPAIYLYIVYGLAQVTHEKYILTADALIPNDIRRLEFKIKIGSNLAIIKIKRNSANVDWNEE